ncbi:Dual-functional monooxygenase/methyltransferase [Lachnellula hyalina]|uniref:Dual-functional monooxygenase/methyltransferase n=1 Tax=Lachnellula hyalina TaxID=1316788 RepID=A0A8H8R643_9HELO|nr:Dual-functional monooxygenase/methyltransferase [Lachnellula hyalina]TVY28696.1 Dual-functional monooxygenase/methyltransferase [Lachnellula hyalina]
MTSPKIPDYDAIVVGAGFSGIRSLWELGQLGLTAKCFEAGSDVGGAWYWNRYPGARTDSEAWVYVMNFAPGLGDVWNYSERYPTQQEVQRYLGSVVDRFNLRKKIDFDTRIKAAHYSDSENIWTISTAAGLSTTCRYFLAASGPLSIAKTPPFAGLKSYTGEWYQTSNWPTHPVDFHGKRVAIIGTGATGVQIIPKLAHVAKELTVFQRTPNYVLPGRNYIIDENEAAEIKQDYDATWHRASTHTSGLKMTKPGRTVQSVADPDKIKQIFDAGWETGGFHFQFETFDELFTNQEANNIASAYVRQKISAIVQDPDTARILSPKHPFLSKRPPCGHFYYEAFNRPNVKLVDISRDDIDLYEKGIRTSSGNEYEFDIIIFALGFDAATGALDEIDVKGSQDKSLKDFWGKKLETFAGVLVPGFPNMFLVCGPHIPFGNMPVVLEIGVNWIGKTLRHMEKNKLAKIDVSETAWMPGRLTSPGNSGPRYLRNLLLQRAHAWTAWLEKEINTSWASMVFPPLADTDKAGEYIRTDSQSQTAIKSAA